MKIEDEIKRGPLRPTAKYSPVPLWGWNGAIEPEEIVRQMKEMYKNHIFVVLIWPMVGLKVKFLSTDYFKRIKIACQEAKRLGMKIWLWDDYNWPSGTGGELLLKKYPECKSVYLRYDIQHIKSNGLERLKIPLEKGNIITIQGVNQKRDKIINLMDYVDHNCLNWAVLHGKWTVFTFMQCESDTILDSAVGTRWSEKTPGYLDTLNPDAVKKFIEIVHERYAQEVGKYFGNIIIGFFADEPATIYQKQEGRQNRGADGQWPTVLPWTGQFLQKFKEHKGYDLKEKLYELGIKGGNPKIRYDYWDVVSDLYTKSYHHVVREWCDKHSLLYSGHLLHEEYLEVSLRSEGSFYRSSKEFHVPGIDHNKSATGFLKDGRYFMAPKLMSSVAHQVKMERVTAEVFSVSEWNLTMKDMKRVIDWLFVLGINQISLSPFLYSLKGFRKRAHPPSLFYQATWWKYIKPLSDYIASLSYILSQGNHQTEIAVLYPFSCLAENMEAGCHLSESGVNTRDNVYYIARILLQLQLDFDFLFEEDVTQNGINKKYKVLILSTETMPEGVRKRVLKFSQREGKVITCISNRKSLSSTQDIFKSYQRENIESFLKKGHRFLEVRKGSVLSKDVIIQHRIINKKDFFFIINTASYRFKATILVKKVGIPNLWNVETGNMERLEYMKDNGKINIPMIFEPYQSVIVSIDNAKEKRPLNQSKRSSDLTEEEIINLDGNWDFKTLKGNVYPLKQWLLKKQNKEKTIWKKPKDGLIPQVMLDDKRFHIKGVFAMDYVPIDLRIIFEEGRLKNIRINGKVVKEKMHKDYYLDEASRSLNISSYIQKGRNEIEAIYYLPMYERDIKTDLYYSNPQVTPAAIIEPIFLVGTFSVDSNKISLPCTTLRCGSWTNQGFPFYSGSGVYRCKFSIKKEEIKGTIFFVADVYDGIMEVKFNHRKIGFRCWEPYRLNISAYIQPGKNELEIVVTNTNFNLLNHPIPSGLKWAKIARAF